MIYLLTPGFQVYCKLQYKAVWNKRDLPTDCQSVDGIVTVENKIQISRM